MNREIQALIETIEEHLSECCHEEDLNLRLEVSNKFEELIEQPSYEHLKESTLDVFDMIDLDEWEEYYRECQQRSKYGTNYWLGL